MQLSECSTRLEGKKRIIKYRINMCTKVALLSSKFCPKGQVRLMQCYWILVKFENALKSRENDPERRYF